MTSRKAYSKINLGLAVGPLRGDGRHEVVTLMQRIDLHDDVALARAAQTSVDGFVDDTIVAAALAELARAVAFDAGWAVQIEKRIPVAAGLGGGSSDAAAALSLANALVDRPLGRADLLALAARVGADVPFFLMDGACVATGDGTDLSTIELPLDYIVVLVVPTDVSKESTAAVYEAFDHRSGADGFGVRVAEFETALASVQAALDLAALPGNDLTSSALAEELRDLGAFRADVSGAGPTVYGLFVDNASAARAEEALRSRGRTFVAHPV